MDIALDTSPVAERPLESEATEAVADLLQQDEIRQLIANEKISTDKSLITNTQRELGPQGIGDGTDFSGSLSNELHSELSSCPEFTSLDVADRHKVIETLENMRRLSEGDGQALELENQLLDALKTERNGQSILLDKDSEGRTTLDNFKDMTSGAMHNDLAGHEAELLRDVLAEITTTITNQGMTANCTVTSMERMLVQDNPAEYTRLMSGLAKEGHATLQNGQNIYLDARIIAQDPIYTKADMPHRTLSARALQTALMNYGAGLHGLQFDPTTGKSVGVIDGVSVDISGMLKPDYERVMEDLTGKAHTRYDAAATSTTMLTEAVNEELLKTSGVLVELNFAKEGAHTLHAVLVTNVTDDYVEFFNPWGSKGDPAGTFYGDPPRTVVNEGDSIVRMSRSEFEKRLSCAMIADSGATFGATAGAPTIYDYVEEYRRNGGSPDNSVYIEIHTPQPKTREVIESEPVGQIERSGEFNSPDGALRKANNIREAGQDSAGAGAYAYHQEQLNRSKKRDLN